MITPSLSDIKSTLSRLGYPYYEHQDPYFLNIIGVINPDNSTGFFKDTFIVCYTDLFGVWQVDYFPALLTPNDLLGSFSYAPNENYELQQGHYYNAFEPIVGGGLRLQPVNPVQFKFWDNTVEDPSSQPVITAIPELRIEGHLGNEEPESVKLFCNGSQYIAKGWEIFIFLLKKAEQFHGRQFSYSLIHQDDFNQ